MPNRIQSLPGVFVLVFSTLTPSAFAQQGTGDIPRTSDGSPDLSGTYDTATLTPLQRPERYGNRLSLTEEEAAAIAAEEPASLAASFGIPTDRNEVKEPPQEAPPVGGDGSLGAAGNVGGYNTFWMDRGKRIIPDRWRMAYVDHHQPRKRPTAADDARGAAVLRHHLSVVLSPEHRHRLVA